MLRIESQEGKTKYFDYIFMNSRLSAIAHSKFVH